LYHIFSRDATEKPGKKVNFHQRRKVRLDEQAESGYNISGLGAGPGTSVRKIPADGIMKQVIR